MSLNVTGVSKSYGATRALADVSLALEPGSVEALIGENGAGKSTLIRILAGVEKADAGRFDVDGSACTLGSPADAARSGIAVVHQNPQWVDALDTLDNLFIGRRDFAAAGGWIRRSALRARAEQVFDRYGYSLPLDTPGRTLTPAARTLLALTRCLLDTPRVLVLDEPTASLGEAEVAILKRVIDRLVDAGCAVLFVTHRLDEVLAFADRVTVMRNGRVVARVEAASQSRESLIARLSGEAAGDDAPARPADAPAQAPLLEVEALSTVDGRVDTVSLGVPAGRIVVLYGLAGAGRTELLEAVFGLRAARAGTVRVDGRPLVNAGPRQAMRLGVRLVPEDRKRQALLPAASVRDNLHLGQLRRFARRGVIDAAREADGAQAAVRRFAIRAATPAQPVAELSGGNQQKLVFARTIGGSAPAAPRLLLCDEPTQAVDPGTRRAIHQLLRAHVDAGGAALVATSDIEELLSLADSVIVLCEGRVAARFEQQPFQREAVLQACFPVGAAR